jgi:hypothetical protein
MCIFLSVSAVVYGCVLFGPSARTVDITVNVVDAQTGEPIRNAKVAIGTQSYGLFDNAWLSFVTTTDDKGSLAFKQEVKYAISAITVQTMDQETRKHGIKSRQSYAALLVRGRPSKNGDSVFSQPNHGHFRIEVKQLSDTEREEIRKRYKHVVERAEITRHILSLSGIEVVR